jgi:hypothetical protein
MEGFVQFEPLDCAGDGVHDEPMGSLAGPLSRGRNTCLQFVIEAL